MTFREVNLDRLIGPSHHYGGLSSGNLASTESRHGISSPKLAALQGLEKMKRIADLGIPQAVLPPQRRPDFAFLRDLGYRGSDREIVGRVFDDDPEQLSIAYSSASMWVANAATISPSVDTQDRRVHITPANLYSMRHRRLESAETTSVLRQIFSRDDLFVVHNPLPTDPAFADEGAANHTRLCTEYGEPGVELFVYGQDRNGKDQTRFPARQAFAASRRIAEQHGLQFGRYVLAKQNPKAIDAGAFHNDVVSVGNENVHLLHEHAFVDQKRILLQLRAACVGRWHTIEVSETELSLDESVQTYFFNSQLVTVDVGKMLLLCPIECERSVAASRLIRRILADDNPIESCEFIDLTQSMKNGGGPACLRLRAALSEVQRDALPKSIWLTDSLYGALVACVKRNYRDELTVNDLTDPKLIDECDVAYREVGALLGLRLD